MATRAFVELVMPLRRLLPAILAFVGATVIVQTPTPVADMPTSTTLLIMRKRSIAATILRHDTHAASAGAFISLFENVALSAPVPYSIAMVATCDPPAAPATM